MEMENSRRSFDRLRDIKKPRLSEEATFSGLRFDRDDSNREGAYQPQPIQSELVGQYKTALAELTFNSKPIITNLTIIAGENLHSAKAISATICSNVIEVPSDQKLPTLYLLDSIVKNIGKDYIRYFAVRLPEVFCKAYRQVESSIHPGMRHLFGTWKGVFPSQCLQMIEKELGFQSAVNGSSLGATTSKPDSQSQRQPHNIHVNPKYLEARQRIQQSSRVKGMANETVANVTADEERVERKSGITTRTYTELPIKMHNINRPLKEAGTDLFHEKKIGATYGDYEYNSDISRTMGFGIGRGNVRANISTQRNGFDTKNKLPGYLAQRCVSTDVSPRITQSITSRNSGVSTSWKHFDEEEYIWDNTNPGLKDHAVASSLRRDSWIPDESEIMVEFENHVRKSRRMNDVGPKFETDCPIDSLYTGEKTNLLGGLSTGSNLLTRSGIKPQTTLPKPDLKSAKRSGDLNVGHQNQVTHDIITAPQNIHPGNLQKANIENLQALTASLSSLQSRHQNPVSEKIQSDHSFCTQKVSLPETSDYKSHDSVQNSLLEPSISVSVDSSGQSNASSLLAAIMKSGILSHNSSTGSLTLQSENQPSQPSKASSASIITSTPLSGPQSYNKSSNSTNSLKSLAKCPPISLAAPSSVASGSAAQSSSVSEIVNPISNLLSSLVAKGLISSENNDSQSLASPIICIKSQNQNVDVPTSNAVPVSLAPVFSDSVSSALILSSTIVSPIRNEVSILEHSDKSVGALPESTTGEAENLIGFVFKPNVIRESHPSVISSLFDELPHQCSICGLRFKHKKRLDRHMEWHSLKNSEMDNSGKSSRKWYLHMGAWFSKSTEHVDLTAKAMGNNMEPMVPADESQSICILCGEVYEDFYCQERDKWMFKGTAYLPILFGCAETRISKENDAEGPIVHSKCISESSHDDLGMSIGIKTDDG